MSGNPPPRLPLVERTRPVRLDDIVGNPRARAELRTWAESWRKSGGPPSRRAVVLAGPPGVGKTSAVLAIGVEYGWSVVEMNASDARNEASVEQIAGRAAISLPITPRRADPARDRVLILLDEADCLTGRAGAERAPKAPPPALRDALHDRYGSIGALNEAWGLGRPGAPKGFGSWDDVPRAAGTAAWTRWPAARADLADWRDAARPKDLTDRGGMGAISRLVRETRQPIALTVNDERPLTRYSPIFRSGVVRVRFRPLTDADVSATVARVAAQEHIAVTADQVTSIAHRSRGDLRAALNDLDALASSPTAAAAEAFLAPRDLTVDLAALVEESLTSARFYRNGEVRDRVDTMPDDLLVWVEENLPRFTPDRLHGSVAFDELARADLLLTRARRARVWSLWSYATELLTGGVGLAIRDSPVMPTREAMFPQFLGQMGSSRSARALRDSIVGKAGRKFHLSHAKTREEFLPFLEAIFGSSAPGGAEEARTRLRRSLAHALALEPDEAGFLLAVEPESPAVQRLLSEESEEPGTPRRSKETANGPKAPRRKVQRRLGEF